MIYKKILAFFEGFSRLEDTYLKRNMELFNRSFNTNKTLFSEWKIITQKRKIIL